MNKTYSTADAVSTVPSMLNLILCLFTMPAHHHNDNADDDNADNDDAEDDNVDDDNADDGNVNDTNFNNSYEKF